jgi:hypothetical protein
MSSYARSTVTSAYRLMTLDPGALEGVRPMAHIPLGHRGPAPADPSNPTGRLLYLPELRAIVAVGYRTPGGRVCWVVAAHGDLARERAIELADARIATAATALTTADLADPDTFALLWLTRLAQSPPLRGLPAHLEHLGRVLAEDLRPPGRLSVTVDGAAIRHLTTTAGILPGTLPGALQRLVEAGLLRPEPAEADPPGATAYTFTLPPEPGRRGPGRHERGRAS